MDFEKFYSKATLIQWSTIRFSYNGLSLVDVTPVDPDFHHTEAYVMFDMLKQEQIEDSLVMIPDTEGVDVRCGLLAATPHLFASACLTYKMLKARLDKGALFTRDEMVVYSFAVGAIKQAYPKFNPDEPNEFMLTPQDTLNHE